MKFNKKRWLPVAILGVGALVIGVLFATRPVVEPIPPEVPAPVVRAVVATPEAVSFTVRAHGTVVPRTESELVPQVAGEVVWVSSSLVSGGFFEQGAPLLRIDPADAEVELESTRAAVARAESEESRAKVERARQKSLADHSATSQSRIDDAENAYRVAAAGLRETKARLARAARDRARTELRAPYRGRVRHENVDPGQFVARGQSLGTLYAVDYAEVRLPIPDRELRYLDLPLHRAATSVGDDEAGGGRNGAEPAADAAGPTVVLRAEFAGAERTWTGHIVRTEGEIDPKSRMVHAVARVADPYGLSGSVSEQAPTDGATPPNSAPLAVGLFVEAVIQGRQLDRAVVLPRTALRDGSQVWVVDAEDRLRFRAVEVARAEGDTVVISSGIEPGERICVSPMSAVVDGMAVRVASEQADTASLARAGS